MSFRGIAQNGRNYRGRSQYVNNYRNDFRGENFRGTQNYRVQNYRGGYRANCKNDNFGRGRSRSRERQCSGNFKRNYKSSNSRSRSGLRTSTNRGRIRCFKCREYDHFTNHCPNSQTYKEPEQIEHMHNLDKDQTTLKIPAADSYDNLIRTNSNDAIDHHLNL